MPTKKTTRDIAIGCLIGLLTAISAVAITPKAIRFPPTEGEHLILPVKAIDGDTIVFYWLLEDTGRLYGINAPERKATTYEQGEASRVALQNALPKCPTGVTIKGREKYGRTLVDIPEVTKQMIDLGQAKPWDGKGVRP